MMSKWDHKYARKAEVFASTPNWVAEAREVVLPLCSGVKTVLDLGCNTGRLLQLIASEHPQLRLYGVDVNQHGLDMLKERMPQVKVGLNTRFIHSESIDLAAMLHVINQIEDIDPVLQDLWRVMKPGGRVVVITHNPIYYKLFRTLPNLFNGYEPDYTMVREPTLGQCAHLLYEHGFRLVHSIRLGRNPIPLFKYRYAVIVEKPE